MKENSYSRNQKKRWMEGQFIGESSRNGIEIWEGLTYKDKKEFWNEKAEKYEKRSE